ncbi:MAG: tetratricopeptide repeat protein [Coxiellaceae bacterium]|nr:tetratricopeptide repeat protein [Coxiellaceae bacterium]
MSLINQMLKDLETGRQRNDKGFSVLRKMRSVKPVVSGLRMHPAWLLLIAVFTVALAAWLIPSRHHKVIANQQMTQKDKQALVKAIQTTAATTIQVAKPKAKAEQVLAQAPALDPTPTSAVAPAPAATVQPVTATVPLPEAQRAITSPQAIRQPVVENNNVAVKQIVPLEPKEKIAALYVEAQKAMDNSDDDKAVDLLKELLVRDPKDLEARQLLATVLLSDNRVEEARSIIAVGLKRVPDYAPFDSLEARILMGEGKLQKAIDQLNQSSPDMKVAPEYYSLLAALYQQNEQFMMAAQLYHQLVQLNPAKGVWWMGLGIALESAEKNNAAVEAFQNAKRAVGLTPSAMAYVQQQLDKLS